jgi:hypothetical protein
MQRFLFITIDTEEDDWGSFRTQQPSIENIHYIPMLQDIFDEYSAVPTYLVNYPVATNKDSVKILRDIHQKGKCEIGTHCHPWNTPPIREELTTPNSFMCNLPNELIYEKMDVLHQQIMNNFDVFPVCFRAGRWGFRFSMANIIRSLNYRIDSSMTPFCDWTEDSGPRFGITHNSAFGFNEKDRLCSKANNCTHCQNADECILEVPATIGFLQSNFVLCSKIRNMFARRFLSKLRIRGVLERLKLINCRWLSPENSSCEDMIKLSKIISEKDGRFLNMCFHSTSLLPGRSPFVRDRNELDHFLLKIKNYLEFASSENISCVGLSKVSNVIE